MLVGIWGQRCRLECKRAFIGWTYCCMARRESKGQRLVCALTQHLSAGTPNDQTFPFLFLCALCLRARTPLSHPLCPTPAATAHGLMMCNADVTQAVGGGKARCFHGTVGISRCKWPAERIVDDRHCILTV